MSNQYTIFVAYLKTHIMTLEYLNKYPILEKEFRANSKNYPAREIAYISRFLNGETDLKGLFSDDNLEMIKFLTYKQQKDENNN